MDFTFCIFMRIAEQGTMKIVKQEFVGSDFVLSTQSI